VRGVRREVCGFFEIRLYLENIKQYIMENFSNHPLYKKHTLDTVMSSLWEFYTKRFLVLFITSFIFSLGMQMLMLKFNFNDLLSTTDPTQMIENLKTMIWPIIGMSLVNLVLNLILQYYIIYSPIKENVNIYNSVYKSLLYLLPYIIISILMGILAAVAMVLGLLVFIIGIVFSIIYIMNIFLFVLPILMAEGPNIGNALGRTFKLSHNNFWTNIGWVAVFVVILIVISMVMSTLLLIPFTGSFMKVLSNPDQMGNALNFMTNPWYLGLSALISALYTPLVPIFAAILYFNGKAREDIPDSQSVNYAEPDRVKVEDLYAKPYSEDHPENPDNM